jgi:hypothetical protein
MNPQIERLFHSIRRGLEENVFQALKKMELPTRKDMESLKKKIERLKKKELAPLQKKLDEMMRSLKDLHRKTGKRTPTKKKRARRK